MDSLTFRDYNFEGMSLPLSCPVGRIIPARSMSVIDCCPHHYANEDLSYSSFSGGSSAPECELVYLPERINQDCLPFTGPSCTRAVDHPRVVHCSSSRSMVHWYRSAERGPECQTCAPSRRLSWVLSPHSPACLDAYVNPAHASDHLEESQATLDAVCADHTLQSSLRNVNNSKGFSKELQCRSHCHRTPGAIGGNVQQRGHYVFVSGVRKTPETRFKDNCMSSEVEDYKQMDKDRACSIMGDLNNVQRVQGEQEGYLQSRFSSRRDDEENQIRTLYGYPCISNQVSSLSTGFQQSHRAQIKSSRLRCFRHQNSCHNIFYSSPENGSLPVSSGIKQRRFSLQSLDQANVCRRADRAGFEREETIDDADSISKTANPLLYYPAGECRGLFACKLTSQSEASVTVEDVRQDSTPRHQRGNEVSSSSLCCGSTCAEGTSFNGSNSNEISLQAAQNVGKTPVSPEQIPSAVYRDVPPHNSSGSSRIIECLEPSAEGRENSPQLQMARIGARRRLTTEQKKMCCSDPDKLNKMEDSATSARVFRSSDNLEGNLLRKEDPSKQDGVAARRKVFETKGRALSTSCLSKTTMKQIQHKALQAYIQRKVVQSHTEPQQDITQSPGSRPSTMSKVSKHSLRAVSRTVEPMRKLTQHFLISHLLVRCDDYADLVSLPFHEEGRSKETSSPAVEASTSEVNGLKQRRSLDFGPSYTTPPPQACETTDGSNTPLPVAPQMYSAQKRAEGMSSLRGGRVGILLQSHRIWASAPSRVSREDPCVGQPSGAAQNPEPGNQPCARYAAQARDREAGASSWGCEEGRQRPMHRKPFFKQESAPQLHVGEPGGCDRACSKDQAVPNVLTLSPAARSQCCFSASSLLSCSQGSQCRGPNDIKSTIASIPMKNRSTFRVTASPVQPSLPELSVDDPEEIFGSFQQVFLSQEMTTEPCSLVTDLEVGRKDEGCSPQLVDEHLQVIPPLVERSLGASAMSYSFQESIQSTGKEEEVDEEEGVSVDEPELPACPVTETKVKSQWEELVEEVVTEDKSLACVFFPAARQNTVVTLMEQMLSEDSLLMEEHYRRKQALETNILDTVVGSAIHNLEKISTPCSSPEDPTETSGQLEDCTRSYVTQKKKLLLACIKQQLEMLDQQRASLGRELLANGKRAEAVAASVQERCPAAEYERYAQFVGDLERVVSLLLCLSARLARVQNALDTVGLHVDTEEKECLDNRHRLLCKQRDDAKELKENLNRRARLVFSVLARHLSTEQLEEYELFVKTKTSLLILQKDLDEKQRLWEEQLQALLSSISPPLPPLNKTGD